MSTQSTHIEVIVAQYGIANEHGEVLHEQAAMVIFEGLRQQETMPGSMIISCRLEGDRTCGKVYATFKQQAQPEQSATITLTIHLMNKVEMTYTEGFEHINHHFPFVVIENRPSGGIRHENGVVTIKLLQDGLTDEQRDWLNIGTFAANYIDSYSVDPVNFIPLFRMEGAR